ncbi:hypothetical protein SLEP1_g55326 [Rubroshorea leprosula]|uniref:Uncharacterized protein n=1 Tax=Rubroshorea leprosula TaxID=152421 RepID=A0AAV5MIW1_9ROSI|nr:hypothetical protein SLEP1_g55326 [Rubroshorea leprosula]
MMRTKRVAKKPRTQVASSFARRRKAAQSPKESSESTNTKQKRRRGGQDDEGKGFDDEEHAEETEEAGPLQAVSSQVPQRLTTQKGMQLILKRLARIESKLDDHINNCQMAAPIGP